MLRTPKLILFAVLASRSDAAALSVSVAALKVEGSVDAKTPLALTKNIVVYSDTAITLALDAHDLNSAGAPAATYPAENIKFANPVSVPANAWVVAPVIFTGLVKPGHYTGQLGIRSQLQAPDTGPSIKLDLILTGLPVVALGSRASIPVTHTRFR